MEMRLNRNPYNEAFSDDFSSDTSDDDSESANSNLSDPRDDERRKCEKNGESENILIKLINRERTGYLSTSLGRKYDQKPYNTVPSRLSFCLKDIVPYCYLQGHMFMGLTVCGQFLVSYKVCYDERSLVSDYNFSTYYKYTLYFWIYRPHQPLGKFFKVCLFDDHGVDNLKDVTMTQWMSHPRILIVHGKSEYENEDSYITIVRVPKLGCLDCRELNDGGEGYFRCDAFCIKCNLTIHTKYSTTESDPSFNPYINLICPERVIIFGNGFFHMLHVELEIQRQQLSPQHHQIRQHNSELATSQKEEKTVLDLNQYDRKTVAPNAEVGCDNKNNIVARIIADFSDCDSDGQSSCEKNRLSESKIIKNYDELIFTCSMSTASSSSSSNVSKNSGNTGNPAKVSLLNHKGKRNHRIVTKSYRNGVTTVDLQAASSTSTSNDKANAYEFSEDNEKCEKIGTFRKRRLADKKYEFSEDNSENIIPYGKSLSRFSTQSCLSRIHRTLGSSLHTSCSNGAHVPPQTSQSSDNVSHSHRASPSHGFRAACGSPIGNSRLIKSPSTRNAQQQSILQKSPPSLPLSSSSQLQHTNTKPLNTLSLRQISAPQRNQDQAFTSNNSPFLSPRREETFFAKVPEISFLGGPLEKPVCTKKFKRRYVEEDDAASVITSEEDDCISPGYHTSLPMEVHGSCYSDMQMISQTSYQKLICPTVIITQHSFDVDSFTYYAISNLCQMNNKLYDVFYDWAVELVNVCPRTNSISGILLAHFTARDQLPKNCKKCLNCSRNIDCAFHRKQFECQILFMWNMETGDWEVLNYGELKEIPSVFKSHGTLVNIAKGIASDILKNLEKVHSYTFNLRVLDSNIDKSKNSLVDLDNIIEFYRKRPRLCTSGSAADY